MLRTFQGYSSRSWSPRGMGLGARIDGREPTEDNVAAGPVERMNGCAGLGHLRTEFFFGCEDMEEVSLMVLAA